MKFFILTIIIIAVSSYAIFAQGGPPPPPGGGGPEPIPINEVYGLLTLIILGYLGRNYLSERLITK